jgi:hypothetical protein
MEYRCSGYSVNLYDALAAPAVVGKNGADNSEVEDDMTDPGQV